MSRVSITRLRLRRFIFEFPFAWHALRSQVQAQNADGCLALTLRRHKGAYWTLTVWRDEAALRGFMMAGAHRKAMSKLSSWCDEASVGHWEQDGAALPSWAVAEDRMAREGRLSAVKHPSPAQAAGKILGSN